MTDLRFFFYGSMCEGLVHFTKIQEFVAKKEQASILATAYRLKVGYPVLVQDPRDRVPGQLVHLETPTNGLELLTRLDDFHRYFPEEPQKCLYFRREVMVSLPHGEAQTAYCYFYNPEKMNSSLQRIDGGDWLTFLKNEPALPSKLTDRQRNYVMRLGAIVGREIVPIDLKLYRELMNLELIVDKGRRLALSSLGQEVYRYLQ